MQFKEVLNFLKIVFFFFFFSAFILLKWIDTNKLFRIFFFKIFRICTYIYEKKDNISYLVAKKCLLNKENIL